MHFPYLKTFFAGIMKKNVNLSSFSLSSKSLRFQDNEAVKEHQQPFFPPLQTGRQGRVCSLSKQVRAGGGAACHIPEPGVMTLQYADPRQPPCSLRESEARVSACLH